MQLSTSSEQAPSPATQPGLIRIAGASYFPIAFMARLPFAMNVVGVMTLVLAARDSMLLSGLTAAAVGLGTAIVGPLLGAAADRWGQRWVMLLAGIVNSLTLLVLTALAFSTVADWVVLAVAVLAGASAPQVSPFSRTRLIAMIQNRLPRGRQVKVLQSTLAYESSADEIVFVFGPVVVGLLASTMNAAAPLIGAAVLTLIFVTAFALHPSARAVTPTAHRAAEDVAPVSHLLRPRVIVVVLGTLSVGFFFGATLTSLTAFMDERGVSEQTGLLYGVMGIGSAILALSVALFPTRFTLRWRWLVFAVIMFGGSLLIAQARDIPTMLIALALTGIGIGPLIVTAFALATERTPVGRAATLMTMLGSAVIVGQSSASAVVGAISEAQGSFVAQWAPPVCAAAVLLLGVWNAMLSPRSPC